MILTAIFEKDEGASVSGDTDYAAIINAWKQQNIKSEMNLDKTAHVYDYDNRIYEVDLTVDGEATVIAPSLQLAFVTDVSRSMYFPAGLTNADTYSTGYGSNSSSIVNVLNTLKNQNYATTHSGDGDDVYYLIADPSKTSTVYAVRWNASTNKWMYIDASYDVTKYAKKGATGNGWTVTRSDGNTAGWYNLDNSHVSYNNGLKLDGKSLDGTIYVANDVRYRLDYLQQAVDAASELVYSVNPSAEIGLVTFAASANDPVGLYGKSQFGLLLSSLHDISPLGGTNQKDGLDKAQQFWSTASDPDHQRVVILVTDGAPNNSAITWNSIADSASNLYTQKSATVHTVGLSIENVTGAEAGLALAAQRGGNGQSYSAKNSEELLNYILSIVKLYLKDANLKGTLHDDIDRVFYPVKQDGTPITPGFYRASDDQPIDLKTVQSYNDTSSAQYGTEYYLWKNNGGQWSITWYNLEFGKGTSADPATQKNFYLKAKEDFMGGNHINTNVDQAHAIGSNAVIREGSNKTEQPMEIIIDDMAETPHVNVDELHLTENSTEWTVYLGTDVTPKDQLQELWDNIKVKQVVKNTQDYTMMNDKNQMWYGHGNSVNGEDKAAPANDAQDDKLPLNYYGLDSYYDALLSAITSGTSYDSNDIPYAPYGHDTIGNFRITATKVIDAGAADAVEKAPNLHTTDKAVSPAETYKIIVTYTPLTNGAAATYEHTTTGGSAGLVTASTGADEVKSENTHIINVFQKGFQITKTNEDYQKVLTGSEFKLYRTPRDGETSNLLTIDGSQYYPAAILDTSSGVATLNPVEKLEVNEKYYLVETKAPAGYNMMTTPIEVKLEINDSYTPKPGTTPQENKPASGMYDWTETAILQFIGSGFMRTEADGTGDLTNSGINADSETTVLYFKIMNNPGYELPSTGGSGTTPFYILGIMLTSLAGMVLLMRQRRKELA